MEFLNIFIDASSCHIVSVQKVSPLSVNSFPAMNPGVLTSSFTDASLALIKPMMKKTERTRSLVAETKYISSNIGYCRKYLLFRIPIAAFMHYIKQSLPLVNQIIFQQLYVI